MTELEMLADLAVGDRVNFRGERMPYTVQARNERYIVCTKPFAPKRTVIYTIIDVQELVRGTENLVFGYGFETRVQCEEAIARLEDCTEVSHRNRVPLHVVLVRKAPAASAAEGAE